MHTEEALDSLDDFSIAFKMLRSPLQSQKWKLLIARSALYGRAHAKGTSNRTLQDGFAFALGDSGLPLSFDDKTPNLRKLDFLIGIDFLNFDWV